MQINQSQIPERLPEQDEIVILSVLRRTDPPNPSGVATPDTVDTEALSAAQRAYILATYDYIVAGGFDPSQSYVSQLSKIDVEGPGDAISLTDLMALLESDSPTEEPPADEPPVEDPPAEG